MKTHIFRSVWIAFLVACIAYVVWLYINDAVLVRPAFEVYNMLAFVGVWIVLVFFLVAVFVPQLLPDNRWAVPLFGIVLVLCAHYYLVDTPDRYVFVRDIMKVFGLMLVIAWATKSLIPESVREERAQKNVEIIEV